MVPLASSSRCSSRASSAVALYPSHSSPLHKKTKILEDSTEPVNNCNTSSHCRKTDSQRDHSALLETATYYPNQDSAIALGEFDPSAAESTKSFLQQECQVLIIGAGGLGCELLKSAVFCGFHKIHIIDMDTIDISNLNRQFLFRHEDIGKSKAECAAAYMKRLRQAENSDLEITPMHKKVQDLDLDFYRQFHVVLCGLDNIEARRYVNSMIVSIAQVNEAGDLDPDTIIPLIDGGTEGLGGQARIIIPRVTSCFECSLESFPPQKSYPMCTIAETPRQPAHCVAYAYLVLWDRAFPNQKLDTDSPSDMNWVYEAAKERAELFGIPNVTYQLVLGVVKNIIPAVASTNAIIAAMCVNEAYKAMTYCSQTMNTYHMHMGSTGCYSHTFPYEKKPDCIVCSNATNQLLCLKDSSMTLKAFIENELCGSRFRLQRPSIRASGINLYMQGPPSLREATSSNLNKPMHSLVQNNQVLSITDSIFVAGVALSLQVQYE